MDYNITLNEGGKTYLNSTPEELLAKGVPQGVVDGAIIEIRVKRIKRECRDRIYAVASKEAQQNMTAAATLVSAKTAANRNAEEQVLLLGLESALGWVKAMRQNVGGLAADLAADPTDDAAWPACPPETHAVADQF